MRREGNFMIADRRLYLTADKKQLVEHGDVKAAFLYAAPGHRIPLESALRFGLVEVEEKPVKEKEKDKAVPKSKDKAVPKSKDK